MSHKGQLTKCAREHVRLASTMEQISSEVWRDAIDEIIEAAMRDQQPLVPQQAAEEPQVSQPDPAEVPQVPHQPLALPDQPAADLPPVAAQEFAHALQPQLGVGSSAISLSMPPSLPTSVASSRRASRAIGESAGSSSRRSGSPVGDLMARARDGSKMDAIIERAQDLEQPAQSGGMKREADLSLEELAQSIAQSVKPSEERETPRAEALAVDRDAGKASSVHPLRQLWAEAAEDRKNPSDHFVEDRGTWKGDWPLPSRSQWQAVSKVGGMWPRSTRSYGSSNSPQRISLA